jgi:16S rRNA pseudouridine516 synthase
MPRLDALLARNLGCSRTKAREVIADGRVRAGDGAPLGDPRLEIPAGALPFAVAVDEAPLALVAASHVLQHKPTGCVTALDDARHPTAYALLRAAPLHAELRAVGRLDLDTSGLLIWTTEGAWLQRLTHPKHALPRTYHAALARPFRAPPGGGLTLEDGHRPAIGALQPLAREAVHPALRAPDDAALFATITIVGGAYHEVRRIFAALGSHVLALCRVSFGRLALPPDLPSGEWRTIDPSEV